MSTLSSSVPISLRVRVSGVRPRTRTLLCVGVFALLALLLYTPIWPLSASQLPAGVSRDPVQALWFLEWIPYAITHWTNPLQSNFAYFPTGFNVAANTATPLLSIAASPITLTLGPVVAFNVLLRLAFFGSATSMYFVLESWSTRGIVAFGGGLLYAFGPYLISQGQESVHLALMFDVFPPLILKCFYELVASDGWSARRAGVALGIGAGFQALVTTEVLGQLALLGGGVLVALIAIAPRAARARARRTLVGVGYAAIGFVLVAGVEIWWAFLGPDRLNGAISSAASLQINHADLLGLVLPTSRELLAPSGLAAAANAFVSGNITENGAYVGVPLLVLLMLVTVWCRKDRLVVGTFLLGVAAFVLSLGNRLTAYGHTTSIPLPEGLFVHLPVLNNVIPARFALSAWLCWVVALAVGLDRITDALASRTSKLPRHWSVGLLGLLVVASGVTLLPRVPIHEYAADPDQVASLVDLLPAGSTVLAYPFPFTGYADQAMLWQAESEMRFRLMGGYVVVPMRAFTLPGIEGTSVENFLDAALVDDPPPPDPTSADEQALCTYLRRYRVGAVLFANVGGASSSVTSYFEGALGLPEHEDANGDDLWETSVSGCH